MRRSENLSETLRVDCHWNENGRGERYFVLVDEIYGEKVILTDTEMSRLMEIVGWVRG